MGQFIHEQTHGCNLLVDTVENLPGHSCHAVPRNAGEVVAGFNQSARGAELEVTVVMPSKDSTDSNQILNGFNSKSIRFGFELGTTEIRMRV